MQEGLLVEHNGVQVGRDKAAGVQTETDGRLGETGVVLFSAEPLLLGGSCDVSIHDKCCRAVVVERRYAENCCQLILVFQLWPITGG